MDLPVQPSQVFLELRQPKSFNARHLPTLGFSVLILFAVVATPVWSQSQEVAEAIIDQTSQNSLTTRIIGGNTAAVGDYPSIVALVSPGNRSLADRLFCGGTVVASRWVMTAAHCVHDDNNDSMEPAFVQVVANITDLEDESAVPVQAVQIIVHPDFDLSLELPPNDIALVELEEDLTVDIAVLFTGDNEQYFGTTGHIAGWGATEYNNAFDARYPTLLQEAGVPLVSNEECNSPESYDGIIADSHVCAGFEEGGIDACAGDSGGPLFLDIDSVQTQVGITSFGIGCGLPNFYGIYTSVSHQIEWLSQYIETPFQSPELVEERIDEELAAEESINDNSNDDDDDDDSFLGATLAPGLFVLLGFCVARVCRPQT